VTNQMMMQNHPARVLLVDDDTALLQALPRTIALRAPEIQIETTDSANNALARIEQTAYDAVITDIKMPGMDGLTLLNRIRELSPDMPTLLITGHGEHDLAIQALRGGAYDFIQKPIDRDYLVIALRRAVHTHYLRQQVKEQQRALEQHAANLEVLVVERTRELIEANAAKDRFLSMASHELKTPLTSLKGMLQLLQRRLERTHPSEASTVTLMNRAVHRIEILVQDLLSTSLIELGQLRLQKQQVDVIALCKSVIEEFQLTFHPPATVYLEAPQEPLMAFIDGDRLSQVLLNLLMNARKYSPRSAAIIMKVMQRADMCMITVQDHGVGIASDQIEHIFERFYRAPEVEVQTGPSPGLGLGLYITQQIIDLHGGKVLVESTPGQGSTFTVQLPLVGQEERSACSLQGSGG
jgi:two-component system sensor histidine kinase/response regulator